MNTAPDYTQRNPLVSRLIVGLLGGFLLALLATGGCKPACVDGMPDDNIVNLAYAIFLFLGSVFLLHTVIVGVQSKRTAQVCRNVPETQGQQESIIVSICPACGTKLIQAIDGDVTIDVCRACGGIWFDNYELQQVATAKRTADPIYYPNISEGPLTQVDPAVKRACPRCNDIRMLKHFFSDTCRIEIDECPSCGGIWLDHGEFESIQASLDSPPKEGQTESLDPETAMLMAGLESEMKQSREHAQGRRDLCSFLGRRYRNHLL